MVIQATTCFSQSDALKPFLILKPFVNTREDVEKIWGKGSFNQNKYFITYKSSDIITSVGYHWGGCEKEYSQWNLPEWSVTDISYNFLKNPPKLNNLIGNNKKFKNKQHGDVLNHIEYYDEERGIHIVYDNYLKEVIHITIKPSLKDEQKFDCDNLK